jgi:hypothetical protein
MFEPAKIKDKFKEYNKMQCFIWNDVKTMIGNTISIDTIKKIEICPLKMSG